MPDYSKGKTYFIWDRTAPVHKLYIGSTVSKLKKRLSEHVYDFEHQRGKCESHILLAMGNYKIELLENFPCNTKYELEDREAEYIIANWDSCLNKTVPGAVRRAGGTKEYDKKRNKNPKRKDYKKQYNKQYNKQYRQQNAEKISVRKSEKIQCNLCGSMCTRGNIAKHRKSKTCRAFVQSEVKNVLDDLINQIC